MPDAYVVATVGTQQIILTSTKQDTLTPVWNEQKEATILLGQVVRFDVYDADLVDPDWVGAYGWTQGMPLEAFKQQTFTFTPNPPNAKSGLQQLVVRIMAK